MTSTIPEPSLAAASAARETAPPPAEVVVEKYAYNAANRTDPFRPYGMEATADPDEPGLLPLQRYELDELKLIAVVVGTGAPQAMIEDPSGFGHVARPGSLITRRGIVKAIRRGEVIVEQSFTNWDGRLNTRLIPLKLGSE